MKRLIAACCRGSCALTLFVPQYAVSYVEGHKYAAQGELQGARAAIVSRGIDLSHADIFGDSIFWPVFEDLSFEWTPRSGNYRPARAI